MRASVARAGDLMARRYNKRRRARPRSTAKRSASGAPTAKDTRPKLPTGTVGQVRDLYPDRPDTDHIVLDVATDVVTTFGDDYVRRAIDFVRKSGVVEHLQPIMDDRKKKLGRRSHFTTRAVLVAIYLAAWNCDPLNGTDLSRIIDRRISPKYRNLLDVHTPIPRPENRRLAKRWDDNRAKAFRSALHRMLDVIDPSLLPKNRNRSWQVLAQLKRDLSIEEQSELAALLDWVCGQILDAAVAQMPEGMRARMGYKPAYCIDGTPLRLFATGRGVNNTEAASDPDGGYYYREPDLRDLDDDDPRIKFSRQNIKKKFCREIHLIVAADISHPDRIYYPALPLAMTTEVPAVDASGAARRAIANLLERGHPPGFLAGDLLYTRLKMRAFQVPARQAGFDLVLTYGQDETGVQASHPAGIQLADGTWYAPCMDTQLADATTAYRAGTIDLDEYRRRIDQRNEYQMRTQQKPSPQSNERMCCPAAGSSPTAICQLKPASLTPRPIRHPDGSVVDTRRVIDHTVVTGKHDTLPTVCGQQSVTVTPEQGGKYRQALPFGTIEQTMTYTRLRESQEGLHGTAKDTAEGALEEPGRRRIRGWAAQALFAAFLLAAVTTRKIHRFLAKSTLDENGDPYVPRNKNRKARTGTAASGTAPPLAA